MSSERISHEPKLINSFQLFFPFYCKEAKKKKKKTKFRGRGGEVARVLEDNF